MTRVRFTAATKEPEDFFRQAFGSLPPTRIMRDFVSRWGAQVVADTIGKLDPEKFEWSAWFSGGHLPNKRRNASGLQNAMTPVYAVAINRETSSGTIFRLVLCALVGENAVALKSILIPELKKARGLTKDYVRAQIDPRYSPNPPYGRERFVEEEYIDPALVDQFMTWWDES